MKWHREIDYHNTRAYDGAEGRGLVVSQARLTAAWLLQTAKRKFEGLLKPARKRSPQSILLKPGNPRGFTVLGAAIARHAIHESALTCPFPEQDEAKALQRSKQRASARSLQRGEPANDSSARTSGQ